MIDGIYQITFRGTADWGMGLLLLRGGIVTGADAGGITYDGTYQESGHSVDVSLKLTVPPGATLVQGTKPQPTSFTFDLKATLPVAAIDKNQPHLVNTPLGPVNVIFRKLRSIDV